LLSVRKVSCKDLEATDGSVIAELGSRIWGRFAAEDIVDPRQVKS